MPNLANFKPYRFHILVAIIILVIVPVFFSLNWSEDNPEKNNQSNLKQTGDKSPDKENKDDLAQKETGSNIPPFDHKNIYPISVMIDNHSQARPAHGLSKAFLVYEAEAEGNITRYLAFFSSEADLEKIGPIRSARPYFVNWSQDLSSLYVHCGGSPQSLANIIKLNINELDEFYNANYFWRDKNRPAPHNIFTSSKLLKAYIKNNNLNSPVFTAWLYKQENTSSTTSTEHSINIDFKRPGYTVEWKYNPKKNNYTRYLDGEIHTDADGEVITSKNLIIQYGKTRVIDEKLRIRIKNIGEGEALICLDGKCQKGKWNKKSYSSRTTYSYNSGKEVEFNKGTTWIEILRNQYKDEELIN